MPALSHWSTYSLQHAYVLMQICAREGPNSRWWRRSNAAPFRKLKRYRVRLFFSAFNRITRSVYPRVRSTLDKKRNWRVQTARKYCSVSARENLLLWSATRSGEGESAKPRKPRCGWKRRENIGAETIDGKSARHRTNTSRDIETR